MFEKEPVSNGFKRVLLDLGVPPPAPQLHFQKHKNVPELAPFEARPSYRQQAMQREGRFHTKVVGFGDVTVSAEK